MYERFSDDARDREAEDEEDDLEDSDDDLYEDEDDYDDDPLDDLIVVLDSWDENED